jgi:glycosyltransferase involved in cell wall biosynthesis
MNKIKVLYVCPYAHYGGHYPRYSLIETEALANAGITNTLLTFCGVTGDATIGVPHQVVVKRAGITLPIYWCFRLLRRWTLSRWLVKFIEAMWTVSAAIKIKRNMAFDVIHLRDGEPFLFIPHLLSLPFRDVCWVVSLTGTNIDTQPITSSHHFNLMRSLLRLGKRIMNSNILRPLYKVSLARNRFLFVIDGEITRHAYSSFLNGVFDNKVIYLPLGITKPTCIVAKTVARKHLGLPEDKHILLSFGAPHQGKDLEVIFRALTDIPNVCLVQAGGQPYQLLEQSLQSLAEKYDKSGNVIIKDYYIPEEEKPYYYASADVVILSYKKDRISPSTLLWEACGLGIPVIASDNVQLRELMIKFKSGLIFRAQDSESLHDTILQFLNMEPAEIQEFRDNCRRFYDEFSMEKWAQRCVDIYSDLLRG